MNKNARSNTTEVKSSLLRCFMRCSAVTTVTAMKICSACRYAFRIGVGNIGCIRTHSAYFWRVQCQVIISLQKSRNYYKDHLG